VPRGGLVRRLRAQSSSARRLPVSNRNEPGMDRVMSSESGVTSRGDPGQDAQFDELYRRFYRPVRDYCRRRVASDLVDDVVAETFVTAWRRLGDVPIGEQALVWLYAVAYRAIGHQWRSSARRRRLDTRLRSVVRHPANAADESLLEGDQHRLVTDAVARLGQGDAEVLLLATWERLAVAEIGAVLGITPNAAAQRLHRARHRFAVEYRRLESRQMSGGTAVEGGSA
jgi:RNA polymerase sigma factor (sigma-70 family)